MNLLTETVRRRKVLGTLKKIVDANKVLGTAFYHESNRQMQHLYEYNNALHIAIQTKLRTIPEFLIPREWFLEQTKGQSIFLIFGGDRSFCGGFNQQIISHANTLHSDKVFVFGKKIAQMMNHENYSTLQPTSEWLLQFAQDLLYQVKQGHIREIKVVTMIQRKFIVESILPLIKLTNQDTDDYVDSQDNFITNLGPLLFASKLMLWCEQVKRSENFERMIAMTQAARNCDESIYKINQTVNRLRQQSITQGLLEVIGGTQSRD